MNRRPAGQDLTPAPAMGAADLGVVLGVFFAAVVCATGCAERNTGDLDAILARGTLRVAVRPGFFDSPAPVDEQADEATMLGQFAARLGVEIEWVEPRRHDRLLDALETGRADLAVARFSASSLIGTGASGSAPVEWVEDVLVAGPEMPALRLEDLRGGRVQVHLSMLNQAQRSALEDLGLEVVAAPEDRSLDSLVEGVRRRAVPLTLIDSGLLGRVRDPASLQVFGPVSQSRPVVWALRTTNPRLLRAVDDFLFADKVLARRSPTDACRDLAEIRRSRVLRLVTRNSPTTCYVARGGIEGFEYSLAVAYAREQRLRLELSIPPPGVDPLDWLEEGFGDLAALHEPMAPSHAGRFPVSVPYRQVDLVSVFSRRAEASISVDDLAGATVAASGPVAELIRLLPVEPEMVSFPAAAGSDAFNAFLVVARGRAHAAVVDEDAARLEIDNRTDLQLGPVVLPDVGLVWVFNPGAPELRDSVNRFLTRSIASGMVRQLAYNELEGQQSHVPARLPDVPEGDLTPYDEYLRWAARRNGLDWRLLASLMYEESRFDPDAVGPGGSAGLFQLMPFTWRELGVEDPHHPGEAIEAGARYLGSLMEKFSDLEPPDQAAMAIASYNVGPRHVFDARRLASDMGFDPDRWAGNVETAMVILDDPEVAREYSAGVCRCRRGAAYARRILRRYAAYTEQFPPA